MNNKISASIDRGNQGMMWHGNTSSMALIPFKMAHLVCLKAWYCLNGSQKKAWILGWPSVDSAGTFPVSSAIFDVYLPRKRWRTRMGSQRHEVQWCGSNWPMGAEMEPIQSSGTFVTPLHTVEHRGMNQCRVVGQTCEL